MPLIKLSPITDSLPEVVTTTLFTAVPSTEADATGSRSSVPVPAIAGGAVAGVILAVVVTLIWVWWGKTIKKDRRKQQQEMEKHHKTRYNTIRNSQISGPKNHSRRPLLKRPRDGKQVKFVGEELNIPATMSPAGGVDPEEAKHMLFDNPNTPPPRPAWTMEHRLRRTGSVIWPIPRNPLKKLSQGSIRGGNREVSSSQAGQGQDLCEAERSISHKPSNVSATSQHSNASGESRQGGRVHANLILAALGNVGSRNTPHAGDRQSTSSLWSYLFRVMPGARNSQHSADNAYQPSEDQARYPVGTAF